MRCCICGEDTSGSRRYIEIEIAAEEDDSRQIFGAHADHLDGVMAQGLRQWLFQAASALR
jgi:hypothetical protein